MTMLRFLLLCTTVVALQTAVPSPAGAHSPSDSYLTLRIAADDSIEGRWDIGVRDLEHAIGLDTNDDGAITWGELRSRHADLADYALSRLNLAAGGQACRLRPSGQLVGEHAGGTYAVLRFEAECPRESPAAGPAALHVRYRLFFDLDSQHRGLLKVERDGVVARTVFAPERPEWTLDAEPPSSGGQFVRFVHEGVRHIGFGIDHLLFLVCLLLPAVVRWQGGDWHAVGRFGEAAREVVKVVTAFTAAHSLTLALATFGWISLDPRIVELLIAGSIVVTALNNLQPLITSRLWVVAFGFGLLHGIGFAGALTGLGLSTEALLLPLVGFNLGVELGQLLLVAAVLPVAFLLRRTVAYRCVVVQFGSLSIAAVAGVWMVEAALGIPLVS
jgi:hypothetical protein